MSCDANEAHLSELKDAAPVPRQVLRSPDGRAEIIFALDDWCAESRRMPRAPLWQVTYAGRVMLRHSLLALTLRDPPALGGFVVAGVVHRRGKPADGFREMVVRLREGAAPARRLDLIFRCYDGAVAVRLRLPRQPGLSRIAPPNMGAVCRFPAGTQGWSESDGVYRSALLDEARSPLWRPLTLTYGHGKLACVLGCGDPYSHISGYVRTTATPWESPWLVLLLGDRPCDLPERGAARRDLGACGGPPASSAVSGDAVRNCMLPFVNPPLWPVPEEKAGVASVRTGGVPATPAHLAAAALVLAAWETDWDETRFLRGEIGAYVVVARRRGHAWQVGGITGAEGRVLTVRLEDFLGPFAERETYALEIWRDPLAGEPAADGMVREHFENVDADDAPRLDLPPGGGFVLRLTPERHSQL